MKTNIAYIPIAEARGITLKVDKYIRCEYCNSELEDKYVNCPNCGAPLRRNKWYE